MSQRSYMHFPSVSCPASYGLSGTDRRQSTSRNGGENGATDSANAYLTAIHPQRSPPIFQTPPLHIIPSQEDACSDMGLSLDPLAYSPGDASFIDFVSPYYQDPAEVLSQGCATQLAEEFLSTHIFTNERGYETSPDEIVEDNESGIHEAPASEAASFAATSNTASPKRRRETPLTEEEKKERNRKYSRRYRQKQSLITMERNIELERARYIINVLLARVNSHEGDIQRLGRDKYQLEVENRSLRQRLIEQEGLMNPRYFEKETGHGNLETRDSYLSDNVNTEHEYSSNYPALSDDFQSPF